MDRGAWWATVQRVAGSQTQLSDHACFLAGSGLSLVVVSRGYSSLQ